jgi:predicted RNA-binding Zn ribbon-like protein
MEAIAEHEYAFHFKSGRLCLDLAATVGERWRRRFDRLRTPADLGRWFAEAGLLQSAPRVTRTQLEAARELREAIYRTAKLAGSGVPNARDRPVEAALATIARDAIELVTGPLAGRVRECGRPDCALLFVDTSRPGRRRWCSMGTCGNRTKTAAYRRRRRTREENRDGTPQP